jgi:hypothetical protein
MKTFLAIDKIWTFEQKLELLKKKKKSDFPLEFDSFPELKTFWMR